MINHENKQIDFTDEMLERLVIEQHPYRKIKKMINFEKLLKPLESLYASKGMPGEPIERGFKCLLIQYWENLSDRELERYVRENLPMRWFCGYKLDEGTPDHSYFGKLRTRIGVEKISELFNQIVKGLETRGYVGNIFHFVDASSLMSRINLWEARDRALADKENQEKDDTGKKKLNNKNAYRYSSDPDARFGCKGKKNFWFGYKRHVRVDMRQGIITKVAVTSANVGDHRAFLTENLCPKQGMVFLDKGTVAVSPFRGILLKIVILSEAKDLHENCYFKRTFGDSSPSVQNDISGKNGVCRHSHKGYDTDEINTSITKIGCANAGIKKNNRANKNKYLDRWRSRVRMPYENVFRYQPKFTRYRKKRWVDFQVLMEAIAYNLKRLITIDALPIPIQT